MPNKPISVEKLKALLEAQFPPTATSWQYATDEVKDLSLWSRKMLLLDEKHAVNFDVLETPSDWNRVGIQSIVDRYVMMGHDMKLEFLKLVEETLLLEIK